MKRDIYQEVTDQIIKQLESGSAPWLKPWKSGNKGTVSMPHNACSGRAYSGINVMLLWGQPYDTNGWITYKQAQSMGGNVQKGQRGTMITYWGKAKSKKAGEKDFMFMKTFCVFNIDQCENLDYSRIYDAPEHPVIEDTAALDLAELNGATVNHGGDRAFFSPGHDCIQMPFQDNFKGVNGYEATLLHELTHWSGHKSRLAREYGARFGDDRYAFEELIAEIGSAFLCAQMGVEMEGLQHANYLANWLRVLKSDKKAIFTAASQARISSEFLLESARETMKEAA